MAQTLAAIIEISSPAFENNGMIPKKYTCDGENINPPLKIGKSPDMTRSMVLIVDDPDAPSGTLDHWVVWDIKPDADIGENTVPGIEGMNGFRKHHYSGPCPPSGTHRYFFKLYALDRKLELDPNATRKDVEQAMEDHILGEGQLVGKYSRTGNSNSEE